MKTGFLAAVVLVQVISSALGDEASQNTSALTREIPVSDLGDYVENENGIKTLKADFHRVPPGQRKSWNVASLPENLPKNRYDDLLAYDETRVVLDTLPGDPYSDYINANYMDGFHREKEYVATQGPLPNTVNDFWRMIWQLNARKIVMLANVIEHGKEKVAKYWPETNRTYGEITVSKISEHSLNDHSIRTFLVKKSGDNENRILRQFHYTGWPDFGVPSNKMSLVSLVQQARKYRAQDVAPLVVHCSAGVGRTGTVILMDSMMERAKSESRVDFLKRLNHMRDQRIDVVEKEVQYVFAHEAVHEVFNGPNSMEYLKQIDEKYREFDSLDQNNNALDEEDQDVSPGA